MNFNKKSRHVCWPNIGIREKLRRRMLPYKINDYRKGEIQVFLSCFDTLKKTNLVVINFYILYNVIFPSNQ